MRTKHGPCLYGIRGAKTLCLFASLAVFQGCANMSGFDLNNPFSPTVGAPNSAEIDGATAEYTEKDVEAPDIFVAKEAGLWDGRPSLGGVWVAHPDVSAPERVMIRNRDNGKSVVGALFRREREIPGPRLQVSSDAARALEIEAGAPVDLNVVALRKERIPTAPPLAGNTEAETKAGGAGIPTATATETPKTTMQSSPPRLEKPYIQVGIFSQEENAERAAKQMRGAGMVPTIRTQEANAKPFWRVIVGPAGSADERKALQNRIRSEGFSDAYAVTN